MDKSGKIHCQNTTKIEFISQMKEIRIDKARAQKNGSIKGSL